MSDANASYEVCILVGERWEIHARHPVTGANAAIEEAKQLSQSSKAMVKVVREVYDDETGLYKQVVVFKSAGLAAATKAEQSSPSGGGSGSGRFESQSGGRGGDNLYSSWADDDDDDDDDDLYDGAAGRRGRARRGKGKAPTVVTVPGLFFRVFIYILVALGLAALVTGLLPVFAPKLAARNIAVMGAGEANALFVVFITTFLLSFGVLALIFLNGIQIVASPRRPRAPARAAAPARPTKIRRKLAQPKEDILKALQESDKEPPPPPDVSEEAPEEEEAPEVENILEAEPEPEQEAKEPLTAAGEAQKSKMTTFVGAAAEEIRASGPVDAFSRFGINLYVAGAVDSLATTQGLEASDSHTILSESVQSLGTPASMAGKFADGAADYLMQPKYVEMYEAGRQSMMAFLEGDTEGSHQLTSALENWRNPAKAEEHSGPLAVLFTDIVGSTSMTVSVGDDAAQYVVRTHNRIVRSALTNFSGREVKHTGDGIMASFATVSNAVEAAIEMQERVIANNAAEGDIPLHLCIGINAGEPVVEDDDLFGVTVQLSARLCAVAESDEIIVSEVVKGLCTGRPIKFESRGTREMKGFADPVPVYEVIWQEGK
ncbi:MAG: adenylate/guanylate cyclase domain-containing protein [Rhodospirillales bacterium]|jgi:adenylate cyclase|nr:adenylate/guanylate cyclase domain-containing protein [Rhodospirillales bacterium]